MFATSGDVGLGNRILVKAKLAGGGVANVSIDVATVEPVLQRVPGLGGGESEGSKVWVTRSRGREAGLWHN